jgi:hypothetical protein
MEEYLVPAHRNQHFQRLGATTEMPKMRKVELRGGFHNSRAKRLATRNTMRLRAEMRYNFLVKLLQVEQITHERPGEA